MYQMEMEGLDEFARAVRSGNRRARPAFKAAMLATVQIADGEIKARTPVLTGRLRSSIRHFIRTLVGWVVTDVFYGGFVEFGTAKMRPRFYFKRGIDAALGTIRGIWNQAMRSLWE